MNPQDIPLPLRDIHLPAPVSWWPPAPGWWALLALGLLLALTAWLCMRAWQRRQRRRDALAAFANIKQQFADNHDGVELVSELSVLLRRVSISYYPRGQIASLKGSEWLQFLDTHCRHAQFRYGCGRVLVTAPYMSHNTSVDVDSGCLLQLCEHWLQQQPFKDSKIPTLAANERE